MLYYVILCYIMLYYVILCYIMLYYVILCYIMLYYVILCYIMLYYVILCYIMLYYVILCYIMLYYVILCYIMLYSNDRSKQAIIMSATTLFWYDTNQTSIQRRVGVGRGGCAYGRGGEGKQNTSVINYHTCTMHIYEHSARRR